MFKTVTEAKLDGIQAQLNVLICMYLNSEMMKYGMVEEKEYKNTLMRIAEIVEDILSKEYGNAKENI